MTNENILMMNQDVLKAIKTKKTLFLFKTKQQCFLIYTINVIFRCQICYKYHKTNKKKYCIFELNNTKYLKIIIKKSVA